MCLNPLPSFQGPWTEREGGFVCPPLRGLRLEDRVPTWSSVSGAAESLVAAGFQGWGRGRDQEEGVSFPSRRRQVSGVGRRQPAKPAR